MGLCEVHCLLTIYSVFKGKNTHCKSFARQYCKSCEMNFSESLMQNSRYMGAAVSQHMPCHRSIHSFITMTCRRAHVFTQERSGGICVALTMYWRAMQGGQDFEGHEQGQSAKVWVANWKQRQGDSAPRAAASAKN